MPIKTFRGLIADGVQDTIVLHTNDGSTGYRIVKFEIMLNDPSADNTENTIQIWKETQTGLSNLIDFSNQRLLGAGYIENASANDYPMVTSVIFDKEIFNQDIYVTNVAGAGQASTNGINYYIELEQIKLDLTENTVATLKDIRNLA